VMAELAKHLRPEDWIVADASYSSAWALDRIVQARAGRQVIAPRGVGTLGWGVPAGMGVQLAAPDANVTVVSGDGAFLFGLPELETAVRWGLGITVVLLDNAVYGSQRHSNILAQGEDYTDLHFGAGIDYPALVQSAGWRATRVTSEAELTEAYATARAGAEPWLIDVATDPEARPAHRRFDELG
jgi:acetolactate synthase-1/2/3 large subunit